MYAAFRPRTPRGRTSSHLQVSTQVILGTRRWLGVGAQLTKLMAYFQRRKVKIQNQRE
jgi:hypothetical protein